MSPVRRRDLVLALGEIVKAECGILESDSPAEAAAKLALKIPETDPERGWLLARLAPLVGAPAEPAAFEESMAAWRRFCRESRRRANDRARVRGSALGGRRAPHLHRAPGRLGGRRSAADPVYREARALRTPSHIRGERSQRSADQPGSSRRCGDRPARHGAAEAGAAAGGDDAAAPGAGRRQSSVCRGVRSPARRSERRGPRTEVPASVQAIIAARLDTLPADRKSLLQDAAVVGKVFWAGTLAAMGDRESVRRDAGAPRSRPQGAGPPRPSELDGRRAGVHVLARPRP